MPVNDYWGGQQTDLNVDEPTEVDLNGNPVSQGSARDIPKSIIDAPGDLIIGVGADTPARLPIGAPGQAIVVAASGTTLEYATPASATHTHTEADLPTTLATDTEVATAITNHEAAADPHSVYLTQTEGDARYRQSSVALVDADIPAAIARDTEVTSAITTHEGAADPHVGYLKESVVSGRGTPALTLGTTSSTGVNLTVIGTDSTIAVFDTTAPSTQAFGDTAVIGTAGRAARRDHKHAMPADPVPAHVAAADPHTGYQLESEKGAVNGYASLDASTLVPTAQLGTGTANSTTVLKGDRTWGVAGGETDPMVWMGGF